MRVSAQVGHLARVTVDAECGPWYSGGMDDVLSERKAARLLGCSASHLARLREAGRGPSHWRIGDKGVRYLRADVLAWRDGGGTGAHGTAVGQ